MRNSIFGFLTMAVLAISAPSFANNDTIRIVGSSTVFPFSAAVAETYSRRTGEPTPIVESTGSGGGMKLFCSGVGNDTPSVTNASRRIKEKEFRTCQNNGVTDIIETKIGYDGIVIANANSAPPFDLTRQDLFLALAEGQGEPKMWNEVRPDLPAIPILVLGPPPSSGTRDAFEELAIQFGCRASGHDEDVCKSVSLRNDGVWVDAGENDNLIVSKLEANPAALGVFGFSFLDQNSNKLKGSLVEGVAPDFDNILSGEYLVSRSLYFYTKAAHLSELPGLEGFVEAFYAEISEGEDSFLSEKGLIPLGQDEAQEVVDAAFALMDGSDLH